MLIISSLILGTWVLTLALTESAGPWGLLERLRNIKWIDAMGLLNCFLCTALYTSTAACAVVGRLELIPLTWGASVIINQLITAYTIK